MHLSNLLSFQLLALAPFTAGITVDADSAQSLKDAATTAAASAVNYYNNRDPSVRNIPGQFYNTWWEGGAFFTFLINYWHWTGDDQYNDLVNKGMLNQKGDANDFDPASASMYMGNDDQEFWALAATTAIEQKFPDVPNNPSWLSLAQGAFNDFVARWETDKASCGGGLRWQVNSIQGSGYNAKNSISNAGFMQLAARLARFTNNQTYADWADTVWDWTMSVPLLDNQTWFLNDSILINQNCGAPNDQQWSYNYGSYIAGLAYMYNFTNGAARYKTGIDGLMGQLFERFFPAEYGSNTLSEISCEPYGTCNRDQIIYKGLITNWLSLVAQLAPYTYGEIEPKMKKSAEAAGTQCSGPNNECGIVWHNTTWDGTDGIEQEMAALSAFANALVFFQYGSSGYTAPETPAPVTSTTGGNSTSDPSGGMAGGGEQTVPQPKPVNTGDRAGAAILTVIFATAWIGMMVWVAYGEFRF
ncbi:putative glycosyl hydrolase [Talaromyces proteolyticus]|uniref:Mannan endo-1,6-alpha-mannosidase n=1 Tax=Talaromyces proteolyticus TaxID=1131652 RepID=A0AAD4KX76_9EURO|nr:putative glycosyl hydrolase [Talaromyces proteolyticus]KAH8703196.1 putative glycosyl hydrolase [Talaromyces proteolyticus]